MPGLIKMKIITVILLLVSAVILVGALVIAGCSSANKEALIDPDTGKHAANWYTDHRVSFLTDPNICYRCHGTDLRGGISAVSCFSATVNGMSCHGHGAGWTSPDNHGAAAKFAPDPLQDTGFSSCQICHGSNFTGGMLSSQTCLNTAGCHGAAVAAPHSPAPWRGITAARRHSNTNTANATVCGLCHLGNRTPPSYAPLPGGSQPGCFNSTLCHGSNVVGHAIPFTNPVDHGPVAKADLTYCEICHANPSSGGAGSNPRFNVPIGSLTAGCETSGCHGANLAHPTQWRGLTSTAPGGHMTAGNMANACALCHGAGLSGGVGPACSTCHTSGSPVTLANCTSCHGNPPTGAASPNREGAHTEHNALTGVTGVCNTCHNGGGTGTANHDYGRGSVFVSFQGTTYNANSGTATFSGGSCSNIICHGASRTQTSTQANQNPPQSTPGQIAWTGAINVNTDCIRCHVLGPSLSTPEITSYYSGQHRRHVYGETLACTACHDTSQAKLGAVHFTSFTAPISAATASTTIRNAINFNGTTCGNPGCHGSETW